MENTSTFILEQYKPLTELAHTATTITTLVQHRLTGRLYVRKELEQYDEKTFRTLYDAGPITGIPQIHYLCIVDEQLILIEDYIHGQTLETIRQEGPLPSAEVRRIAIDLCQILERLHHLSPPVIHRDIKPTNVMLTDDGVVKLIDYDAARQYKPTMSEDTHKLGTAGFASPEQFGFSQTDARSDIYSLGVLMNVLLTGESPRDKQATGALRPIIQKCTDLTPSRRYKDSGALLRALMGWSAVGVARESRETASEDAVATRSSSWAPPGFRSRSPWKMLLAFWGYGAICSLSFTMKDNLTPVLHWANCATLLLALVFIVLFAFDYRGVRHRFPFMSIPNLWLQLLFGVLWCVAIVFGCICLNIFFVDVFGAVVG